MHSHRKKNKLYYRPNIDNHPVWSTIIIQLTFRVGHRTIDYYATKDLLVTYQPTTKKMSCR